MDSLTVGHKTLKREDGSLYREPLEKGEADEIIKQIEKDDAARAAAMPSEKSALNRMMQAYLRLKELGWNDAAYCPKDGSKFLVIEAGSTGIHECIYEGDWPKGSWCILADGDVWPSRPMLWKPLDNTGDTANKCKHGRGVTAFCEPCGRINGGN